MQHNGVSKHQRTSVQYRQITRTYIGYIQLGWVLNISIQKAFFFFKWTIQNECVRGTSGKQSLLLTTLFDLTSQNWNYHEAEDTSFPFFLISIFLTFSLFFPLHTLCAVLQKWTQPEQSHAGTRHGKAFFTLLFQWLSECDRGWGLVLILSFHNSQLTKTLPLQ